MKSGIISIVLSVLFFVGVLRLGHAFERINPAEVVLSSSQCARVGVPATDGSCLVAGALAGRLDGGWVLTPASSPDRSLQLATTDISYTYSQGAWRLSCGGNFLLPALLLLGIALVVGNAWLSFLRHDRSRTRSHANPP